MASRHSAPADLRGRFDYAAIGTVTNVASRLCDGTKPSQILITPRVLLAVGKAVTVEPSANLHSRGIAARWQSATSRPLRFQWRTDVRQPRYGRPRSSIRGRIAQPRDCCSALPKYSRRALAVARSRRGTDYETNELSSRNPLESFVMGKGILLWLFGVPIPVIIIIGFIFHWW